MYKLSKYNLATKVAQEGVTVFNTRTGATMLVEDKKTKSMFMGLEPLQFLGIPSIEIETLIDCGFIVKSDFDEDIEIEKYVDFYNTYNDEIIICYQACESNVLLENQINEFTSVLTQLRDYFNRNAHIKLLVSFNNHYIFEKLQNLVTLLIEKYGKSIEISFETDYEGLLRILNVIDKFQMINSLTCNARVDEVMHFDINLLKLCQIPILFNVVYDASSLLYVPAIYERFSSEEEIKCLITFNIEYFDKKCGVQAFYDEYTDNMLKEDFYDNCRKNQIQYQRKNYLKPFGMMCLASRPGYFIINSSMEVFKCRKQATMNTGRVAFLLNGKLVFDEKELNKWKISYQKIKEKKECMCCKLLPMCLNQMCNLESMSTIPCMREKIEQRIINEVKRI